jgi:hypothetical protein
VSPNIESPYLPKEVAVQEAKIEENFLKEAQKEDIDSEVTFDGNDKMALTFKKDTMNLARK